MDGMLLGAVRGNNREDGDGEAVEGVCFLGLWGETTEEMVKRSYGGGDCDVLYTHQIHIRYTSDKAVPEC